MDDGTGGAYIGWVEDYQRDESTLNAVAPFVLIDLLHPDEVMNLRGEDAFARLVARPYDGGLKTLPIVLPVNQLRRAWKKAIERAAAQAGQRLLVRLGGQAADNVGRAEIALRGWEAEENQTPVVYVRSITLCLPEVSRVLGQALRTLAYRQNVAAQLRLSPHSGSREVSQRKFLRDILEWRVKFESEVFVAVYDVGQGSASAIVDVNEHPRVFFDMGKPISVFEHTTPLEKPDFFACDRSKTREGSANWKHAPVVLSHWDFDHWAGVLKHFHVSTDANGNKYARLTLVDGALERYWIAPDQEYLELGPTHLEFIRQLLKSVNGASGRTALQYWPAGLNALRFSHGVIVQATPDAHAGASRSAKINNSGLVMLVTSRLARESGNHTGLLLQGDARYEAIPLQWTQLDLVGIVISHHGGPMGAVPNAAVSFGSTIGMSNIVCSVGAANSKGEKPYGHPDFGTLISHVVSGWGFPAFTYERKVPASSGKKLGNYVLSLDENLPECGCDCVPNGNLSLNAIG